MDIENGLKHVAFFEALAKLDERDPHWRGVSAGLVVMRLVDAWIADGPEVVRDDSWGLTGVLEALHAMDAHSPTRRILTGVVDAMRSSSSLDLHVVTPRLMAYGQTLEYDTHWTLAADVYRTIIVHGHPTEEGDLVVSASIQLGHCLRNIGDLRSASAAYARASELANAAGDLIGVLRARIGDAKVATSRGNMPEAEDILDETIARAAEWHLHDVRSRALHDRATVAGMRGQHDRLVQFGYQALAISTSQREKDRILVDVATGFLDLGLVEIARDAYLILQATAQDQYVRWVAGLNLIEVASRQGMEPMFDRYRRDFEKVDLPPYLQVKYYLNVGNGYRAFGRVDDAIPYLERALDLAEIRELNQLVFEAESSLGQAETDSEVPRVRPPAPEIPEGVFHVATAIQELRRSALASR